MEITPQLARGAQLIESYGNGGFKIAGVRYAHSVMVTPDTTTEWTHGADPLSEAALAPLFALTDAPEVVLFGLGTEGRPLPGMLRNQLRARGMSADVMDTGAASRTFNILLAEGRRVVALLIAV